MQVRLKFLFLYYFLWILLFELSRIVFLIFNYSESAHLPFSVMGLSLLYGLRMDVSMATYILIPVCLFVLAGIFIPFFGKTILYKIYSYLWLFFVLMVVTVDLELYRSWRFRIDATPLRYLSSPKEVWASISHLPVFLILILFALVYLALCFLFGWFIQRTARFQKPPQRKISTASVIVFCTALLIIPLRGGFQLSPINQSSVYFSRDNYANLAAVNAPWNFIYGLLNEPAPSENPFHYLDPKNAKAIVDSLYQNNHNAQSVLRTNRPNIILVIWESFTEKSIHAVEDGVEVTPRFNELKKQGIYFSNVYASGDRTDKGIAAVLSGYPALNGTSIIRNPNKSARLNTLGGFLKQYQYHTSFYYGGETEFANLKSYILQNHFDVVVDKSSFHGEELNSKWGAHDGVVAKKIISDLGNTRQPFFTTWLTLSSHEPFETPVPVVIKGNSLTERFENSLHYTDEVLYQLVHEASQQPWWNNTLFIIIADHGHPLIEPSRTLPNQHIPMLWLGGALNRIGEVNRIASQVDLATSIEKQINPQANNFFFSKDLFDSTSKEWAFFSFANGFGLVQAGKSFVFDNIGKRTMYRDSSITERDLNAGKAIQQFLYQDYLSK
ncbi:MAG: LTA synthase family protein [Flavisolibacter sp.]